MKNKGLTEKEINDLNLTPEQRAELNAEGEKIAQDMGYESGDEFAETITRNLNSQDHKTARNAARAAGSFASKLSMLLFEQVLYNSLGTADVYKWVNKFNGTHLKWGNSIQFSSTFTTTATSYDRTKFIPTSTTDPFIETFTANFKKPNGTLATNAYQYKKSLSLDPKNWLPYFNTGKLATVIANITEEMRETYRLFVANKLQQLIKQLASGTNQVTTDAAGENGSALRLKKIEPQNMTDAYTCLIELSKEITNLVNDSNTMTISSDSPNIRPVKLDDLVIFVPKKLLASFKKGVLSRLPSAGLFDYEELFSSDRVIPIGVELKTIQSNNNEVVGLVQNNTPFLGDDTIVVLEKSAIQHCFVIQESESQYFAENMIQQLTSHIWGFFCVLPFKKGFVFKSSALTTLPN